MIFHVQSFSENRWWERNSKQSEAIQNPRFSAQAVYRLMGLLVTIGIDWHFNLGLQARRPNSLMSENCLSGIAVKLTYPCHAPPFYILIADFDSFELAILCIRCLQVLLQLVRPCSGVNESKRFPDLKSAPIGTIYLNQQQVVKSAYDKW